MTAAEMGAPAQGPEALSAAFQEMTLVHPDDVARWEAQGWEPVANFGITFDGDGGAEAIARVKREVTETWGPEAAEQPRTAWGIVESPNGRLDTVLFANKTKDGDLDFAARLRIASTVLANMNTPIDKAVPPHASETSGPLPYVRGDHEWLYQEAA